MEPAARSAYTPGAKLLHWLIALLRLAAIGAFCAFLVYLASAAFVPAMETGGWDFLFIGIAVLGLGAGALRALGERFRTGKRR